MAELLATNNIASSIIPIAHPFSKLKKMSANIRSLTKTQQIELVFFGFLSANKSIEPVIDAVAELKNGSFMIRLTLISPMDKNNQQHTRLQSRLNDVGGSWLTEASLEKSQRQLASSDIAIFPFNDGASPKNSTLLAAMSVALPVVSTGPLVSPLNEEVIELSSLDVSDIALTIKELASDKNRRIELSEQGQKLVNDRYNWENITKLHRKFYQALV
jgi:glycosyltransferase involved in cell wall biosynthesis